MAVILTITNINPNPDGISVTYTRSDDLTSESICVQPPTASLGQIQAAMTDRSTQINTVTLMSYDSLISTTY